MAVAVVSSFAGCATYMKAMDAMPASSGTLRVVNTMAVGVCGITLVQAGADEPTEAPSSVKEVFKKARADNGKEHMSGDSLAPGQEGTVSIPLVGKLSENKPQPESWSMEVYGCDNSGYTPKKAGLLMTMDNVKPDSTQPIALR